METVGTVAAGATRGGVHRGGGAEKRTREERNVIKGKEANEFVMMTGDIKRRTFEHQYEVLFEVLGNR